jgi:hypothetical protein
MKLKSEKTPTDDRNQQADRQGGLKAHFFYLFNEQLWWFNGGAAPAVITAESSRSESVHRHAEGLSTHG